MGYRHTGITLALVSRIYTEMAEYTSEYYHISTEDFAIFTWNDCNGRYLYLINLSLLIKFK